MLIPDQARKGIRRLATVLTLTLLINLAGLSLLVLHGATAGTWDVTPPQCLRGCYFGMLTSSGSTVSITEAPLVTRSSTMRQVCPFWNAPSMAFLVP